MNIYEIFAMLNVLNTSNGITINWFNWGKMWQDKGGEREAGIIYFNLSPYFFVTFIYKA